MNGKLYNFISKKNLPNRFSIRRRLKKTTTGQVAIYLFMILLAFFSALPLVYLISTSFKPIDELFVFPPRFFVRNPTARNYHDLTIALDSAVVPFVRSVFNSLFVTACIVVCTVLVSSLGAYGLVKHKPIGHKTVFSLIIAALMFSPYVTQISRYMVVNSIGLVNSYFALIIPNIAVAYNFFLMRQFVEQFPNELIEAARIDGCRELSAFWKVVMPSLTPAWATLIVFSFISNWNDYFTPLVFTTSPQYRTIPLALQSIAGGPATMSIGRIGAVTAASVLMILPCVIIFLFMQRKVMETMMYSGIK